MSSPVSLPNIAEIVGRNIRAARESRGMTQPQLAVALSVDQYSIHRWERGRNRPAAPQERGLADILFDGDLAELYRDPEAAT